MPGAARRWLLALGLSASGLACPGAGQAHTGFPEARQILLRPEQPGLITVATNFGLISSSDGGGNWTYSCEQAATAYAGRYSTSAPPSARLFALSGDGVAYTEDRACTWTATGSSDVLPYGFAPDAFDAERVYVFGAPREARAGDSLYVSRDGGQTLGEPVFSAAPGDMILTVLPTQSEGALLMSLFSAERGPVLLRSDDHGESWGEVSELAGDLGLHPFELLAVGKSDDERVFARVLEGAAETLAISDDGGRSFARTASLPGKLAGFVELESGTILVAGTAGTEPIGYRSTDGGRTFEPWLQAPRVHALAEQGGQLYVAADNFLDGYALARSEDEGLSLTPLLHFSQVRAVDACVSTRCAEACDYYAELGLWPHSTCGAVPVDGEGGLGGAATAEAADGGGGAAGSPSEGGARYAGSAGAAPERTDPPLASRGGACTLGPAHSLSGAVFTLLGALLALLRRRPSKSAAKAPPSSAAQPPRDD